MRGAGRFLARRLRCGRFLRFQGFHPMSPNLNQVRNARLIRPRGGVKDQAEDTVVAFVLTRTWFMNLVTRHMRPKPSACVDTGRPWESRMPTSAPGERKATEARNSAAALMCGLGGSGSRAPITFSQFSGEQLQHHVVTDPGRNRIVASTFVAKKGMCGVELMPLEVRAGIA